MEKKLISANPLRKRDWCEELHDSEIARKHRGELTKARKLIQEDTETQVFI